MGCICSKETKDTENKSQQLTSRGEKPGGGKERSGENVTINALHTPNHNGLISLIIRQDPSRERLNKSLLVVPPADALTPRYWINKRGHLIRNWRRRYCVLDKNEIKYYKESQTDAPFGKHLKGQVALVGAVCMVQDSEDLKNIEVEIYGSQGDKDLFFYVENTEDGREFVNIVQWAIRKATVALLLRGIKMASSSKEKDKEKGGDNDDDKSPCSGWLEYQDSLFEASLEKLRQSQIHQFVIVEADGSIAIRPGYMKLWTAFGENYSSSVETDSEYIGLAWHVWQAGEAALDINAPSEDFNVMSFEDIVDVSYQYLDQDCTKWLTPHMSRCFHSQCCNRRYLVVSIKSDFGFKIHFLACCLTCYEESILALQNILLYIQYRSKVKSKTVASKQTTKNVSAVAMALEAING